MHYLSLGVTLCAAALLGCASTPGAGVSPATRGNVITAEEIAATTAQNAFEAVGQLRRRWLMSRGSRSIEDPSPVFAVAFLDDQELGDLSLLRGIDVAGIREIRFIDGREAVNRYGSEFGAGIVQVITR